jgi:hypothetical protein
LFNQYQFSQISVGMTCTACKKRDILTIYWPVGPLGFSKKNILWFFKLASSFLEALFCLIIKLICVKMSMNAWKCLPTFFIFLTFFYLNKHRTSLIAFLLKALEHFFDLPTSFWKNSQSDLLLILHQLFMHHIGCFLKLYHAEKPDRQVILNKLVR